MSGMPPVEFVVFTEPQQGASYAQLRDLAQAAEELGYDGFFRSDHYLHTQGGDPALVRAMPGRPSPDWPGTRPGCGSQRWSAR